MVRLFDTDGLGAFNDVWKRRPMTSEMSAILAKMDVLVIDLETGGLDETTDALLEIGFVIVASGSVVDYGRIKVLPGAGLTVTDEALQVNRWTPDGAINELSALTQFMEIVAVSASGRDIVYVPAGHVINFDMRFLTAALSRNGVSWPDDIIAGPYRAYECGALAWTAGVGLSMRPRLDDLATKLGVYSLYTEAMAAIPGGRHTGLYDAMLAYLVLLESIYVIHGRSSR